ncbi:hypothetical protein Droror1_Dr00019818 [Drosera rotundifolia]
MRLGLLDYCCGLEIGRRTEEEKAGKNQDPLVLLGFELMIKMLGYHEATCGFRVLGYWSLGVLLSGEVVGAFGFRSSFSTLQGILTRARSGVRLEISLGYYCATHGCRDAEVDIDSLAYFLVGWCG